MQLILLLFSIVAMTVTVTVIVVIIPVVAMFVVPATILSMAVTAMPTARILVLSRTVSAVPIPAVAIAMILIVTVVVASPTGLVTPATHLIPTAAGLVAAIIRRSHSDNVESHAKIGGARHFRVKGLNAFRGSQAYPHFGVTSLVGADVCRRKDLCGSDLGLEPKGGLLYRTAGTIGHPYD